MPGDIVRYGMISTARIGISAHLPGALKSHNSEIVAISSRSDEAAELAAKENGIGRWYGTYEELLADPDIDAVINPLPNSMHHEWTIKAAEAGKHVLCEKPIAVTMDEVREMIAAAEANGVLLVEAFTHRLNPHMRRARQLVAEGAIGDLRHFEAVLAFTSRDPSTDVRFKPELGGGGLWDAGCYAVSAARFILDAEPTRATGFATDSGGYGVDTSFSGLLEFPGGAIAHVWSSVEQPRSNMGEVIGTTGKIQMAHLFEEDTPLVITDADGNERVEEFSGEPRFAVQLNDFSDCILNGTAPEFPPEDGLRNTAAVLALYESAEGGKVASVEQV
ncbi:MAG: Gfo/Idh/MocA family oxidoreductase [Dehalococcoidia bacterium]|jgi:predicted dehydrogenase|nr:Gfo/Idh/MocA family oxidoreductase [Dehalococcoidia bacterium]